jgi:serine/threonine protein kinase
MPDTGQTFDAPLLLSRYRPVRLLARGGSSIVFSGRDEVLGRDVAIKLFNAGSEADVGNQREELRVLAGLSHHGVVAIIDAGIDESTPSDPRPFLVMELVQGQTLWAAQRSRKLSPREIGEVGFEIAEVLEYVHFRGVTHRDITPSNIMLVEYGTTASRPRARLTDFGIAIDAASGHKEQNGVTGTVAYLSPEQISEKPLTPATDIYSLGLVLIESFTGTPVFPGTAMESAVARVARDPELTDAVPAAFRDILHAMTQRKPADRPTAADLLGQLRGALRQLSSE